MERKRLQRNSNYQKYRIYFFEPRITRQFSYLFTNLRIFLKTTNECNHKSKYENMGFQIGKFEICFFMLR